VRPLHGRATIVSRQVVFRTAVIGCNDRIAACRVDGPALVDTLVGIRATANVKHKNQHDAARACMVNWLEEEAVTGTHGR
jgi:hypothetical protein